MKIGLHDSDKTKFPNLALMKLSAWHKAQGDTVEWFDPSREYNTVYSSKVFTFTPEDPSLPEDTVKGGTGYKSEILLAPEIEHILPDYSLYPTEHAVGFLTRGCNRKCGWCVVPGKEGKTRPHADISEFITPEQTEVVLLDNNVLQSDHGIAQIEAIAKLGLRIDFNQGLDARMIDDGIARLLGKVKWRSPVRLACDHMGMMKSVQRAVTLLRWHNVVPRRYFCYCLVQDVDDAVERVKFLKGLNVDPFAQPYIDFTGESVPTPEQRMFARWVNHKAEFKSRTWEDYRAARTINTVKAK